MIATLLATITLSAAQPPNPAIVPAPRGESGPWIKRHESFVERARQGDVGLLFLGDSITQGWDNNPTWVRSYAPRKSANFGIGGDRTQHVLWRITHGELDNITPKAVVLMIGTNNAGSDEPAQIAAGIEAIVKELRAKLPESEILLLGVFPRNEPDSPLRKRVAAINEGIKGLDADPKVTYLDIGPAFLDANGTIPKAIMADGLHLSPAGYRRWSEAMEPTLAKLLGPPQL